MWHDCVDGENGEGRGRREYGHGGTGEYTDPGRSVFSERDPKERSRNVTERTVRSPPLCPVGGRVRPSGLGR